MFQLGKDQNKSCREKFGDEETHNWVTAYTTQKAPQSSVSHSEFGREKKNDATTIQYFLFINTYIQDLK